MSLRLISKRIVGITSGGIEVPLLFGADPEEDDNNSGENDGGEGENNGGDGDGSEGQDDDDEKGTVSRVEYAALQRRMQAADQNRTKAEKERDDKAARLKEIEDKDKGDLEKAAEKVTSLESENESLKAEMADLRFANAFAMTQSKYVWHDPEVVLAAVRKDEAVTVEEDGTVKGISAALDRLAKAKPYLVKDAASGSGRSGNSVGSGGRGGGKGEGLTREGKKVTEKYRI